MNTEIKFQNDPKEATIFVMKVFPCSVAELWDSFSKPEILEKWWAPKPWKTENILFDFQSGGKWLYAMVGPEGEKHFAGTNFNEITFHRSISWKDYFCDEEGNLLPDLPTANWLLGFTGVESGAKLTINIHFDTEAEMNTILKMGFEEGFKMGLNQLEDVLKK